MGWATAIIARLKEGETVFCNPRGNSMRPLIESGERVKIVPVKTLDVLQVDDIVLCRVKGSDYLHLITDIKMGRYQISNNHGRVNGWCDRNQVYGRLERA